MEKRSTSVNNLLRLTGRGAAILAGLLLGGCSGGSGSASQLDDVVSLQPGEVPVIDTEIVEVLPDEFVASGSASADLYDTLAATGTFTRFLALFDKAGIDSELRRADPVTVFAPDDDAFAVLDSSIGQGVVDTFSTEDLLNRLKYHTIVSGALDSAALFDIAGQAIVMGNELPAEFNRSADGDLMINNGKVTIADIPASNGVVHVIDTVLTPPEPVGDPNDVIPPASSLDISNTLLQQSDYSTLLYLIEETGLTELLQGDNGGAGWTLFAPSDDAFSRSGFDELSLDSEDKATLIYLHLYNGTLTSSELNTGVLPMIYGSVNVSGSGSDAIVGGANIVGRDRVVGNGIIHYVDAPLRAYE